MTFFTLPNFITFGTSEVSEVLGNTGDMMGYLSPYLTPIILLGIGLIAYKVVIRFMTHKTD